ncbi:hypothetical protein MSG28_004724 [Choristoneura fumiferana]|uniref:Uncharacterized protein n=1 Tax=Choristoneura fumiferana TaxID=7141 RepID=A0ACC0K757_CHOFU|nr:hypothetical protein MSG28_004724 [Choristoneura fumiferana]
MRNVPKKKIIYGAVVVIFLIVLLHPDMNGRRSYEYIPKEAILDNLYYAVTKSFKLNNSTNECDYRDIVFDDTTLSPSLKDGDLDDGHKIRAGGECAPLECRPKFSTAIVVPYRNRPEQLHDFLIYMHTFLRRQQIHYRIYVIEQLDSLPFNRAKLMNIGAKLAMKAGFPCLVLHDVDLLPLRPANLYACTYNPRHLSSSINKFRYVLPYLHLFGGAIAIRADQFRTVNGMSNQYYGWGGEDDDFYSRLENKEIKICRFEPATSVYYMLNHKPEVKGEQRHALLDRAEKRMPLDGLNNLKYTEIAATLHPLFTHIMINI